MLSKEKDCETMGIRYIRRQNFDNLRRMSRFSYFTHLQVIGQQISPARKKRRSTGRSGDGLAGSPSNDSDSSVPGIKKDKLYCICKQKYDATKFYVGCDICSNWFHGSCVNITPRMSKKMSE